jgi:uncharacterized caspase-like protein
MPADAGELLAEYTCRRAVVIGINAYAVEPLQYAVNDAKGLADVLANDFGFDPVYRLLDADATKGNIETS